MQLGQNIDGVFAAVVNHWNGTALVLGEGKEEEIEILPRRKYRLDTSHGLRTLFNSWLLKQGGVAS